MTPYSAQCPDANLHTLIDEIKGAIGIFTPDEVENDSKEYAGRGLVSMPNGI